MSFLRRVALVGAITAIIVAVVLSLTIIFNAMVTYRDWMRELHRCPADQVVMKSDKVTWEGQR